MILIVTKYVLQPPLAFVISLSRAPMTLFRLWGLFSEGGGKGFFLGGGKERGENWIDGGVEKLTSHLPLPHQEVSLPEEGKCYNQLCFSNERRLYFDHLVFTKTKTRTTFIITTITTIIVRIITSRLVN